MESNLNLPAIAEKHQRRAAIEISKILEKKWPTKKSEDLSAAIVQPTKRSK
jgi:hypothetical protein